MGRGTGAVFRLRCCSEVAATPGGETNAADPSGPSARGYWRAPTAAGGSWWEPRADRSDAGGAAAVPQLAGSGEDALNGAEAVPSGGEPPPARFCCRFFPTLCFQTRQ